MPRATRRRGALSKEKVLRAAVALADRSGVEGLTMRAVATRVGAEAMSLYRHVRGKEELLDALVDLVYAEIELPTGVGWRDALRRRAISARDAMRRHPWALSLMESRSRPGPENLRHHDAVVGVLRDAGFSSAAATRAYNLLDSFIYGFALQERSLPFGSAEEMRDMGEQMLREMPAGLFPHLAAVVRDLIASGFSYADEFEAELDVVLDAIERLPRANAAPPPA